ncbi:MAG: glycosyltransferase family 4 protein [Caldilineaceae bacterium]
MRILHVVLNTVGKGTYWRALHLARHQVRRSHEVTLIATSPTARFAITETEIDGVRLVAMPDLFSGSLRSGWDLWNAMRRVGWLARHAHFDVVHAYECRPTVLLPMLFAKYFQKTAIVLDWSDWFGRGGSVEERPNRLLRTILRPVETFFEERFRGLADRTTVICTLLQEKARQLGIRNETILLLPNGAEVEKFQPLDRNTARKAVDLPLENLYLGYVGNIFRQDAQLLAAAFNQVHGKFPESRLLVIGYCALDLRTLVTSPEAVIQTGRVGEEALRNYLAACDLFCLPLRNSNANRGRFPMKLTDYMAMGRPIVASAVGDISKLFEEEAIGRLAADTPESFGQEIEVLLTNQPLRDQLGRHARIVAEERFDWALLTDQLLACYQEL